MQKKIIKYVGWVITSMAIIYTIAGYIDITSDASTSAYAPLVLAEGCFYIVIGLAVTWFGYRSSTK